MSKPATEIDGRLEILPVPAPTVAKDPRPVEPERPLPMECCDSGCDSCVHDVYADEVEHYRDLLAAWQERNPGRPSD